MNPLNNKTLFITGASRGIGLAIGLRAARDGANVVVAAKTDQPHPSLPGTVHSAVAEIEAAGGKGLACVTDIRFEEDVLRAVERTVEVFGGIDILVNNASAIFLAGTEKTPMKRFDLMHQVNTRGTFLVTQCCIPHLRQSANAHVLNVSPPLNFKPQWFAPHVAYSMAKYGMSLCVLGMADELKADGIAVNALWPRTAIATAAVQNLLGGDDAMRRCRKPEIMADAAHWIVCQDSHYSGHFLIDDEVLQRAGIENMDPYAVDPAAELMPDFFV